MKFENKISEQQLNAFLDNELDNNERAQMLTALRVDKALSEEYSSLQQIHELVVLAYQEVPTSPHQTTVSRTVVSTPLRIAAAVTILVCGGILGWLTHQAATPLPSASQPFTSLAQLNVKHPSNDKILIHINAMDNKRIVRVLNEAEQLLRNAKQAGTHLQLEIVANESGLGMLRKGSPYAHRIQQLANSNKNVAFLACGVAMENARLKEGHPIKLISDAHKIDAALEQILRRLKSGWLYVRA